MSLPRKEEKDLPLTYDFVGVSRWNICQKLASIIYHSELDDSQVEKLSLDVVENLNNA